MSAVVIRPFARSVASLAPIAAALGFASCAATPLPAQGFSPTSSRAVRLDLTAINAGAFCSSPYPLSQVRAQLTTADGKVYATPILTANGLEGGGVAPLSPADLSASVNFGQLTADDLAFRPPFDLLTVIGGPLMVRVWVTNQPNIRAQLVIQARFDCPQYVNLSGRAGSVGTFSDRGTSGEPGPLVRVAIAYLDGPTKARLVLVRVEDGRGIRARTVVSPGGPPLQILLDGGSGGPGGEPFWAGVGARKTPPGVGGDGGEGGGAEIEYDQDSPELEKMVLVFNRGGAAGVGGNGQPGRQGSIPRTQAAPVRQLFHDELAHGVPVQVHGALEPAKNESI